MSRKLRRKLNCKAVTGIAVLLCLIVTELDLQACPTTNDDESSVVSADPDISGAGAQSQPTQLPTLRIPRPPLFVRSSVQIPSERVTVAQATTQSTGQTGTSPPTQKASKKKLLIIVAAAAGVAAVVLLTRKSKPEEATITAGLPTVGQP